MCGGNNYPNAPRCCEPGAKCVLYHENFHQCMPEDLDVSPYETL